MGRQSSRKAWRRRERERFLGRITPEVRQWKRKGTAIEVREDHGRKMSQVLLDFVRPVLCGDETLDQYKAVVALGTVAWNAALLPPAERRSVLDGALTAVDADAREAVRAMLQQLIDRKLTDFAGVQRLIAGYEVSESGGSRYVQVASLR